MKAVHFLFIMLLVACSNPEADQNNPPENDTTGKDGSGQHVSPLPVPDSTAATSNLLKDTVYANQRFRGVKVEKQDDSTYRVTGEGQIFEARFGWVVEDGHNELARGYESTAEGAPAWGDFSFLVTVQKQRSNSSLHLVLFETSAKDGSRQYELAIPLQ